MAGLQFILPFTLYRALKYKFLQETLVQKHHCCHGYILNPLTAPDSLRLVCWLRLGLL